MKDNYFTEFCCFLSNLKLVNCQYFSYRFQLYLESFWPLLWASGLIFLGSCLWFWNSIPIFYFWGSVFIFGRPWALWAEQQPWKWCPWCSAAGAQGPSLGVSCNSAGEWVCWPLLARPGVQMWPRPCQISASLALEAKRTICCPICARSSLLEFGQWYTAAENDVKDHES